MARVGDSLLVRWCANTAADDTQGSAVAGEANPSFIQRGFEVRKKKTLLHVQSITFTRLTRCGGGGLIAAQ
jgi:hypothetical protein